MVRNLTSGSPIFFVCGTPSDRYGFECKSLDGRRLPDQSAKFIDVVPKDKFPKRGVATHILHRVDTGGTGTAIYAEYRWIHPNDTEHNRGAYIAVGCWTETPLTIAQAMEALYRIETVHSDLAAKRNPDTDIFPPEFQLHAYTAPTPTETNRDQLADMYCQASAGAGTYNDEFGMLIHTSEQIAQGSLARFRTPTRKLEQAPPQRSFPNDRSWGVRLHEVMQEAMNEAPQTRQALRKLLRLEDERTQVIKTLTRAAGDVGHGSHAKRRMPHGKSQNVRSTGNYYSAMVATMWKFTTREAVFLAIGVIFGLMVALAVIITVRFVSEDDQATTRLTIESEVTPSPSR